MKRFFALVLSVLMILSLCSFASAASSEITLHARDMNMNYLTGTFSIKDEGSDYYRIIDAAGNELMGTDRKYTSVYPSSSYPVFTVEVASMTKALSMATAMCSSLPSTLMSTSSPAAGRPASC